jgi:drug/metabolite transporter (DMT)-like permease
LNVRVSNTHNYLDEYEIQNKKIERRARGLNQRSPNPRIIAVAFAMVYLFWGSTFIAVRFGVETIPPLMLVGMRQLIAGIVLYPLARFRDHEKPTIKHWLSGALIGGLLLIGGNGSIAWAEAKLTPTNITAVLVATVPVWMAIMDWLRPGGPRPTARVLTALGIGLVGVSLLVSPHIPFLSSAAGTAVSPACALVLVCGSLCWAAGSILSRHLTLPRSPLLGTSVFLISGGIMLFPLSLALGEGRNFDVHQVSLRSGVSVLYLAVFGSILGFTAYTYLLRHVQPARVATYAYINPVIAVILGWIFAREPVSTRMLIAAVIILGAVVMVITAPHAPATEDASGQPVAPD